MERLGVVLAGESDDFFFRNAITPEPLLLTWLDIFEIPHRSPPSLLQYDLGIPSTCWPRYARIRFVDVHLLPLFFLLTILSLKAVLDNTRFEIAPA
jgi:hypothetical protein